MLQLEAVLFNDDPLSAANGLNLRRNAREFIPVPEWRRGLAGDPDRSPVAYARSVARRRAPTLRAQVRRTGQLGPSVQVRAVEPTGDASVLGSIRPRTIAIQPDGSSAFDRFELENPRLGQQGVGIHDVRWRWQFRSDPHQPWVDFANSEHRVYCVLGIPGLPWQQTPYAPANSQLPWTEVLHHACDWGAGAQTLDQAATLITRAVFDLGTDLVEYGCEVHGFPQYSLGVFHCSAFLDMLEGGAGRGRFVNCQDCATIVSTFSNILGCRLWQSGMGRGFFPTNPIIAIGTTDWGRACGWQGFNYHEVAWKGQCTSADPVFDACVLVDGDQDPARPPHTPLLPTNVSFGQPGDGGYRDHLAALAGRAACEPLPWTRQQRPML